MSLNSIKNQIHNMIWDSAVFQSINECRKYAPKNEKGEVELNGEVHHFINRCFFETQAIAIRRFLDKRNDVISLYRLVNDILWMAVRYAHGRHTYALGIIRHSVKTMHRLYPDWNLKKDEIILPPTEKETGMILKEDYLDELTKK